MPRDLKPLRERLFFTLDDMVTLLAVDRRSAQVLCSRYIKSGRFIRLKRDFYVLEENWVSCSGLRSLLYGINSLKERDYTVKLGSLLEEPQRRYYIEENFKLLKAAIREKLAGG